MRQRTLAGPPRFHEGLLAALSIAGLLGLGSAWASTESDDAAADIDARLADEEAKLGVLNGKLAELESELDQLDSKETTLLGELHRLDLQIRVAREQLELLGLELKRGYREVDENLERIAALEASIDALRPYLTERTVALYKLGRLSYVRLLLSVEQPSELTRAYRYVSRLARDDGTKMEQFLQDQQTLEETKETLRQQTERMIQTKDQLESTTRGLSRRRASRRALLEEIDSRREMASALLLELEGARERLSDLVAGLAQGEPTEAETVHLPMRIFEGEIGWPTGGALDGRFGRQLHPRFRTVTVRNGIEIASDEGTEVRAVYSGEVAFASWFEGYGKLLILRHPGNVHTLYGFLADFAVEAGDWVDTGDPIALVGETGSLEGPRLYFEIRVQGSPVDPEGWLDPARELAAQRTACQRRLTRADPHVRMAL